MSANNSKLHGTFKITPITPIHISSGENYQKFEYFIDTQGKFYLKDLIKFFLDNAEDYETAVKIMQDLSFRPPAEYIRYTLPVYAERSRITTSTSGRMQSSITSPTPQSLARGGRLDPEMAKIMKQAKTLPKEKPTQQSHPSEPILQPTENVFSFIKDPFSQPYIPGSSLKGCIRTAITYAVLKSIPSLSGDILNEILTSHHIGNKKVKEILPRYLTPLEDAKYDLFKALIIRDSAPLSLEKINIDNAEYLQIPHFGICQIQIVKKRNNRIQAQEGIILAESLLPTLEKPIEIPFYIDRFILSKIIQVAEEDLQEIRERSKAPSYSDEKLKFFQQHKHIFEKVRDIFLTPQSFSQALRDFSQELVKAQSEFFKGSNYAQHLSKIFQNHNNDILLQIGFSTGYLSKTIALVYDIPEIIKIQKTLHLGKGTYYKDNPFPRSRRLSTSKEQTSPLLPMGWFKLEIDWKK